jgi:tetratricopeptide (TPR) repeat protein
MKASVWYTIVVSSFACLQISCSSSPQADLDRGNRLAAQGKYADAEILYRKSLQKNPKFAECYYRLGVAEYQMRHGAQALEDLQRAVNFDPGNDRYNIELASVAIEAYQVMPNKNRLYEQAAHEADVLLKKDPDSFDGRRLRGDVLVIDRKYGEALLEFRKANGLRPNDPNVVQAMAQILFSQNQEREGEELIHQFLGVRRDFPPVYDLLETHYMRTRRFTDAERLFQSEIAALPKEVRPRLRLAGLYQLSGRVQEMSQELTKIVSDRTDFPDGPAAVGDFYADSGKWDDALRQYRAGIQGASDQDLYHRRIERALESLGKREEAIGELDAILKKTPNDPGTRLNRAVLLRQSADAKERDTAISEFQALAAQYPANQIVHYNLALSYLGKGDNAAAWRELKKSAELKKDYVAPRLMEAEMALTSHNYTQAIDAAGEALAIDPNNINARLLRAGALVGSKSYGQAQGELNSLSALEPDSKEVGLQLAALAQGQKDYPKAKVLYRRFYRPGSSDLRPLEGLLQVCVLERQPEKAQALLEGELKQAPDSRPIRLLLASFAAKEGKFDIASEQYRWLQSKDPKSPQLYSALGELYRAQGATQEALSSYEKAHELAPNDTKILSAIALLESGIGQTRLAIATLNKQLALDPNNAAAMNNLAFDLAETGTDLDRALTLAERVARKYPNEPGVIDTLGWVYVKRGLNQSAIQVLRGLVKKYPNEPAYRYHLAVALLQDKQTSDAKREFVTALANHPPKDLSNKIQENLSQVR